MGIEVVWQWPKGKEVDSAFGDWPLRAKVAKPQFYGRYYLYSALVRSYDISLFHVIFHHFPMITNQYHTPAARKEPQPPLPVAGRATRLRPHERVRMILEPATGPSEMRQTWDIQQYRLWRHISSFRALFPKCCNYRSKLRKPKTFWWFPTNSSAVSWVWQQILTLPTLVV